MAHHVWTVICRRVIVDQLTQSASLIDVIEGFEYAIAPEFAEQPIAAFPFEVSVATLWARSAPNAEERTRQRLQVFGPDLKVLLPPAELDVDLKSARNHRNIFNLQGLPFAGDGDYTFQIDLQIANEWVEKAKLVLFVKRRS